MARGLALKQIEMFGDCPRQWWHHYIDDEPFGPMNEGAEIGSSVHKAIAYYWRAGELPENAPRESLIGRLAMLLIQQTRHELGLASSETEVGVIVDGRAFQLRADGAKLLTEDRISLVDYKVTGAREWNAKLENGKFWTIQSLENCIQARFYAHLLFTLYPKRTSIEAQWIYVSRKSEKAWSVEHFFTRKETAAWWRKYIEPRVEFVEEWRKMKGGPLTLRDIPINPKSCEFTGRFCDAAAKCSFVKGKMHYGELEIPQIPEDV